MNTETITWQSADAAPLPDAEITVLVELKGGSDPVWIGYYGDGAWIDASTGGEFVSPVVRWAELPRGLAA